MTATPHFPSRGSPAAAQARHVRPQADQGQSRRTRRRGRPHRATHRVVRQASDCGDQGFVDTTTLPVDELPPALAAFFVSAARPATQARMAPLASHRLGRDSELERRLCELIPVATRCPHNITPTDVQGVDP